MLVNSVDLSFSFFVCVTCLLIGLFLVAVVGVRWFGCYCSLIVCLLVELVAVLRFVVVYW